MILRMPIDIKSLYQNIENDNKKGHTPTVATPLKQGNSIHSELAQLLKVPENINEHSKEELSLRILSKSRAEARIVGLFVFDRITVNGLVTECNDSFCIYIREETSPNNVHCGRQKVHYPQTLEFEDENVSINNGKVLKAISSILHDYAFIVQAFEYNTENLTLNFDVLIVGENSIPYSKVFIIKRGVGEKFTSLLNDCGDNYDTEIMALRSKLSREDIGPDNFYAIMQENRRQAMMLVGDSVNKGQADIVDDISSLYPCALFDMVLRRGILKQYYIVRFTSTHIPYFSLSSKNIRFINEFPECVKVALITDLNGSPTIHYYSKSEIGAMKKTINSVTFEHRG